MPHANLHLGIDAGSVSLKIALIDRRKAVVDTCYIRHHGQPIETVTRALHTIYEKYGPENLSGVSITGTAGSVIADIIDAHCCNEIIAITRGIAEYYPHFRTVIEMGGEDSKLLLLRPDTGGEGVILEDFSMNSACAAGTGSFLDQQASRLEIDIEDEFGEYALRSKNPPHIAGRCSVFAKSDMIHLQQIGTPDYDIVAGLCFAVARNFHSAIAKGAEFVSPVAFIGGVASNKGMVRAFSELLNLTDGELIVPDFYTCLGAAGVALIGMDKEEFHPPIDLDKLRRFDRTADRRAPSLEKLTLELSHVVQSQDFTADLRKKADKVPAYIGIDIGSVSTNVVVLNESRQVIARRYLATAGRPIEAVKTGLREIKEEIGDSIDVRGVGTTGSGRYMIGDLTGADIVRNEITAQARGTLAFDPSVDTIFEIGGQDSKFISIENGVVVDFAMNKVCAAGTGSFLEEQAERLDLNIKAEFESVAMACDRPLKLGERCTVFIESDLFSQQQAGASKGELVSGLAYSIVRNYLNRVVDKGRIGDHIFFQGGTANNRAVVAAFEKVLNKKITVPPHNDVTGAIGIALLAMENDLGQGSRWKGFGFVDREYTQSSFVCKSCSNHCEVKRVKFAGEKPLFYGSRCERFDFDKKIKRGEHLPDLFDIRERLLLGPYYDKSEGVRRSKEKTDVPDERKQGEVRIGIPRLLQFHENFPFWRAFFESIGWKIVLSSRTTRSVIHKGTELVTAEFCFPMKVAHGHVDDLLKKDVDFLFLPSLINQAKREETFSNAYNCPFVQSLPYVIRGTLNRNGRNIRYLEPHIMFQKGEDAVVKELNRVLKPCGVKPQSVRDAFNAAIQAQKEFREELLRVGRETLDKLESGEYKRCLLMIGRSYNTCDDGMNLTIPKKLKDLGALAMPFDMLPVEESDMHRHFPNIYWKYGQRILGASEYLRKYRNLFGVYITNFGCGPDSMITHLFKEALGDKPYLLLEIDEHSADAGILTRCEAYLDSLDSIREREFGGDISVPAVTSNRNVKLYIPYMCNHAHAFAAAFRTCGVDAEVLPEPTDESAELGRRFTNGRECFPCIVTMGDLMKKATSPGFDRKNSAFFMPTASGPCRFGQYVTLHRLALEEIGFGDVPVMSPGSHNSYADFDGIVDSAFRRRGWIGFVVVDVLEKLLREVRPYELVKGSADAIFDEALSGICHAIERNDDLIPVIERYRDRMAAVPVKNGEPRIVLGMVGEIFLRLNRYSNSDIIRKIEEYGAEVRLAPMSEWILYTNSEQLHELKEEKRLKEYLKNWLKNYVQERDEHTHLHPLAKTLRYDRDPKVGKILKNSSQYIHRSCGGEAILSVGKAIDYIHGGVQGIVNVQPFTCMPGTIVTALSNAIRRDYNNVPWLNAFFDGQQDETGLRIRLETFVHQARQFEPAQ